MPSSEPVLSPDALCIGLHRVVRGRDMYLVEIVGDLTFEHMPIFLDLAGQYAREWGYMLVLVNGTHAGTMHAEARRLAMAFRKRSPAKSATAVIGARLATRSLVMLLFKAMELISGKESAVAFFKTESEARVWLDGRRSKLAGVRR